MTSRLQEWGLIALSLLSATLLGLIGWTFAIIGQHIGPDGRVPSAEAFGLTALLLSFREVIASIRAIYDAADRTSLTEKLAGSSPAVAPVPQDAIAGAQVAADSAQHTADQLAEQGSTTMIALTFLAKYWQAIAGGIGIIVLAVAVHFARADGRQCHARDAIHVAERDAERAKNLINLASIKELEAALAAKEADTAARADAFADSKTQNAANVATADARQAADKGRSDTLLKLATTLPTSPDCNAPSALLNNLKGL